MRADLVNAFGATLMFAFAPRRFLSIVWPSCGASDFDIEDDRSGVPVLGEAISEATLEPLPSSCSSASTPNESFPFATLFRFFFGGGP